MDVSFEISDRYYEELGSWPLRVGVQARVQLYAFRDHSPAQQGGGRLLLPDLAMAPVGTAPGVRRSGPLLSAVCGLISEMRSRRPAGSERRDEVTIRLECGVPICLVIMARRWDHVDLAPAVPYPGIEAWRSARPLRIADLLSGTLDLQEAAFDVGGVSSFPLLDEHAPDYPVTGSVARLERLDLDPTSPDFGTLIPVDQLPDGLFWPHRYIVTLST